MRLSEFRRDLTAHGRLPAAGLADDERDDTIALGDGELFEDGRLDIRVLHLLVSFRQIEGMLLTLVIRVVRLYPKK